MPYAMTHLLIAESICNLFDRYIKDLPQFYLGNIAPDAVHNRADYISDYKKASHLCVGDEKWGMITNNDAWINNVIAFLNKHRCSNIRDYIAGYCCHILSDIYQNIALYMPFKKKYSAEIETGIGNKMIQETNMVDIELALTHEKRGVFQVNIRQSRGIDLANIIYSDEIEKQKDNFLTIWYAKKERPDLSANEIVTVDIIMNLIKNATTFIEPFLREYFDT